MKHLVSVVLALCFAVSVQGATFDPPQRLSDDGAYSGYPAITYAGSDTLVVAWHDRRHLDNEIYVTRSTDRGATWSTPERMTNTRGDSRFPEVASNGNGVVHLVWQDNRADVTAQQYDIYYRRSTDGGATWEDEVRLVRNPGRSLRPCIAASGSTVLLAWHDITNGMFDIYLRRSTDGGATWADAEQLTSKPDSLDPDTSLPQQPPSILPRLAIDGRNVALTWYDCRHDREPLRRPYPDNWEIYLQISRDTGATWEPAVRLTDEAQESTHPTAAWPFGGSLPVVAWSDGAGNSQRDIFVKTGDATATRQSVGAAPKLSMQPRLVRKGTTLGLFWHDNRDDANVSWQVFFSESTDAGQTWSPAQALTDTPRFAGFADVATDGQRYYLVYQDDRYDEPSERGDDNFEILFQRGQ